MDKAWSTMVNVISWVGAAQDAHQKGCDENADTCLAVAAEQIAIAREEIKEPKQDSLFTL